MRKRWAVRSWRISELRQCLGFTHVCRKALRSGDLSRFFRYYGLAQRSLNLARSFGGATAVTSTATLARILSDLGDLFEAVLAPEPRVEAYELVPQIFESLKVLQREGVEVEDDVLMARARNTAAALTLRWRFIEIGGADEVSTSPTGDSHAN